VLAEAGTVDAGSLVVAVVPLELATSLSAAMVGSLSNVLLGSPSDTPVTTMGSRRGPDMCGVAGYRPGEEALERGVLTALVLPV